ncbi:type II toxin-antitoxin system HicB family antitoxin [Thiospirillum jenense]|uniref:type II toxin-antitoxin system HicB family antitoxin n=1 Tax=Thiospirillum jenense TaxID=1653858 RepID=UPI001EEBC9D3|nr:type II toxin-antitoxin system HicB family antitoxin [Thiospirillum jenense]
MNTLIINGYRAVITFDPELNMFRGEFIGLNGGADFYATDVTGLKREGEISLRVFQEACEHYHLEPNKTAA